MDRWRDRHADRPTDRLTDRQTDRQTDREEAGRRELWDDAVTIVGFETAQPPPTSIVIRI